MATEDTEFDSEDKSELISMRKSLGLTQTQMASELGMSLRAYSDIETGKTAYRQIHRLAVLQVASKLPQLMYRYLVLAPKDNNWGRILGRAQRLGDCRFHPAGMIAIRSRLAWPEFNQRLWCEETQGFFLMNLGMSSYDTSDEDLANFADFLTGDE